MDVKPIKQNLSDAGCMEETSDNIIRLCEVGNLQDALRFMRKDRCRLMAELHESGRKVDLMDLLIRSMEKEIRQAE